VRALDYLPQSRIGPPDRLDLPFYVPQFHHGYRRKEQLSVVGGFAAISLADMLEYAADVTSPSELRARFGLARHTELIAVGVAKDHILESWWRDFSKAAHLLSVARVAAVTVPNFSIFEGAPRHQNLISIARLHHFAEKLTAVGLPTVPHLYAQNSADWSRWERFLMEQRQVRFLAIECQTGLVKRRLGLSYIEELSKLQTRIGRPLHIVAVGGAQYVTALGRSFDNFTIIDSQPFMKTLYRRGMTVIPPLDLKWVESHTPQGHPLDGLLAENVVEYSSRLAARLAAGAPRRMLLAA
jgi:hypothetical protein